MPQISEQFRELSQKLYERPNCIEDLTEQREFVKTVPDLIQANQSRIDQVRCTIFIPSLPLFSLLFLSFMYIYLSCVSFYLFFMHLVALQVMADYDLLDDYFFTLSDEDFENR